MEAKNKALEVDLSEEKQMRQDKEQEVGQFSTILLKSLYRDNSNSLTLSNQNELF